jgi:hypothetical protein
MCVRLNEIDQLHWSCDHVKEDEMGGARSTHWRNEYRIKNLVGKPEWKTPLGRPRCRWSENIRMDLREIGWELLDWMYLDQYRDKW